jgi:hypothetical protein
MLADYLYRRLPAPAIEARWRFVELVTPHDLTENGGSAALAGPARCAASRSGDPSPAAPPNAGHALITRAGKEAR